MFRKSSRSIAAFIVIAVLAAATDIAAGTSWVDDDGSDSTGDGSQGSPWKTITWSLSQMSSGDTLLVMPGTYDGDLGEVYPISIPSGIVVKGSESAQSSWPRIGGDAAVDQAASSVVEIMADDVNGNTDVIGAQVERLYFLGEDSSAIDAPPTVVIRVDYGNQLARSGIKQCYFERPEMNDSGEADSAVIVVEVGQAGAESVVTIESSTICASARGGIEIVPISGTESTSLTTIDIRECQLIVEGADEADFGVLLEGLSNTKAEFKAVIRRTTIDSAGVTSPSTDGFLTGIDFSMGSSGNRVES